MSRRLFDAVVAIGICLLAVAVPSGPLAADEFSQEKIDFFEAKIRPLLVEHCYECHSEEAGEMSGDLRVDAAAPMLEGGSLGPAVVPGRPGESLLLTAVEYSESHLQMPPAGKLAGSDIESLRRWIEMGAPDPRRESSASASSGEEEQLAPLDRDPKSHWAFVVPDFAEPTERTFPNSHDLVDDLAITEARASGVTEAPEAPRETLIRRLYFDLTGLPPSYEEIQAFERSRRPDAYVRVVDRLLASPGFGERFGRHWLDVARYADTIGYATAGKQRRLVGSERFRDWTIGAFGSDMPYDEMIMHQLAGDRTDPSNEAGNLDAMGFLTVGRRFLNRHDTIDDRIDVITRGLLGLTVSCARCHDHKFDPIPTVDYYSLYGILNSSQAPGGEPSPLRMVDKEEPRNVRVFRRGQPASRGQIAPRGYLTALRKQTAEPFSEGSGRHELAKQIASDENPLTARVMVNRLWAHLVGKPLVESPSDFGFRTERPAVPGILDDLAAEFSEHWSIKRIVRRIVLTRIYRQSADVSAEATQLDPDNRLLARANRRRRGFESMRDSILSACGWLHRELGGEPVEITSGTPAPRRTVYAMIDRQNLPALFRTFDFASPDTHSPRRYFTTVPQQALYLLNNHRSFALSRAAVQSARRQARDQQQTSSVATEAVVRSLCRNILGRDPSEEELQMFVAFARQPLAKFVPRVDPRSLWSYGTIVVNDGQLGDFLPFEHYKKGRWQPRAEFPAEGVFGHANLAKENGHPGKDASTSVCRRWHAPVSGELKITGMLGHRTREGDGIIAGIWVGGKHIFGGEQKSNNRPYGPLRTRVEAGQAVDFVASPGETSSFDSFFWRTQIQLAGDDGQSFAADSVKDFSGPFQAQANQPLTRLEQLAQVLLMSNEFAFVD